MTKAVRKEGPGRHRFALWLAGFDLLACTLGFSFAVWLYRGLADGIYAEWPAASTREIALSALIAWVAIVSIGNPWGSRVRMWIDRLFSAVGFNLLLQYGLHYLFHVPATPWPVAVAGGAFAVALAGIFQKRRLSAVCEHSGGTLLLGYDSVAESILPAFGHGVIGVLRGASGGVSSYAPSPLGPPVLGDLSRFDEVMASAKPSRIVVNEPCWPSFIPPRRLLAVRYGGVVVEHAPALFEKFLERVCWQRLSALDLLLSPRLKINHSAIALQAIYTNMIGLALLLLLSPVLILAAVLATLGTARAPLESAECPGFQRIPFRPLRFRTRRRDGRLAWSGKLLALLHLVDLPQLINVVRGEMVLFGPPPVRKEFADRLTPLIPVFAHRFTVKPGMMGWSQANLAAVLPAPDERLRLEYDLYYIREESPSLDLDILLRTLFRAPLSSG